MYQQQVTSFEGMNIQNMFAVPIGWRHLDGIDNNAVIEYCKTLQRHDGQSNKIDLNHSSIKPLVDRVNLEANRFHKSCGMKHSLVVTESWHNDGNPEYICRPHTHSHAFSVATYYLNDSDVELYLLNPINSLESVIIPEVVDYYTEYNRVYMTIPPKEGLLLVFPAWIVHYVENIKDNRMSVAFNLSVKM